jgi:pimeloyl-ACP methyl ester carboxylesterase
MRRRPTAAALALLLVAAGCSGRHHDTTSDTTTPTAAPGVEVGDARTGPDGFVPKPISWDDCSGADCASVQVPLDYDQPDGKSIHVAVLRVPASGERRGTLFVNPGGPGGSALEFAAALPGVLPDAISEHFDIVGVEPRGLTGSAHIDCDVDYADLYRIDPTVETPADRDAMVASADDYAAACAAHAGDLLPHVGTRDDARDMDSVRAAIGDAQLSYFGGSYGTVIGQVYAELFPTRVKSMVLDGIVELGPSGLELAASQSAGFEVALQRFADHCKSSGECANDDPIAAVERVQALAEQPGGIPAPGADRSAGPGEVNLGLGDALYSATLWPSLDAALADALHGDGSGMVGLADEYLSAGDFAVYFAVNCIDFAWPTGDPDAFLAAAKAAGQTSPHFGEALVTDYLRCVDWPVAPDPLTAVTAPGSPPILVISTTGDPATPYEGGVRVAERLSKGILITNQGDGHGAVTEGSACVNALVAAYLLDGAVPRDGTVCT